MVILDFERSPYLSDVEKEALKIALERIGFGPLADRAVRIAARQPAIGPAELRNQSIRSRRARAV